MSKTVQGLLEHCRTAYKNNVQYVYGAKMKVMTKAEIKSLQNIYGTSYVWKSDLNKAGKLCCDCSGLISSYTGVVRNSSNYAATALAVVTITELKKNWNKYVGWGLWMPGHIGVVSDQEGYYYAMDGSARNMVHNPMYLQGWKKCIKLCDITYSTIKETPIPQVIGITNAGLNIRKATTTNSAILDTIPKGSNVLLTEIENNGWYKVNYKGIVGYCSNNYITILSTDNNIKNAINKLSYYKVISSPDYWIAHYNTLPYLDILLLRSAIVVNKNKSKNDIETLDAAVGRLISKKIIVDPTYWLFKVNQVKYLKELIISIANTI